ncbi:MAG: molybdopterin-dependent oxidoreductase, partial [Pelobacteraceae bacterium]
LGKAGACRACAVKMLEGPAKGIQMSCMLPALDGMVVSTTDPEAVAMRRAVIEWLMINHPHDCPVCDEGGECQLQDFTIAGGHGIRRYNGLKRTHVNQYLGEFIEHEMNRCIQCYRCVRFYQEYAGGTDFGVMGRSDAIYFGRQQDGQLESPFSGNLADICPTGVFTDKTARFRARYWDYDMAPSVCPGCSLGCNTVPMARYRELLKTTARRNDEVNGWFICDRGRFSNAAVNATDRPRQALVDGRSASMDEALDALVERLEEFLALHGSASLAVVGSPRMSLEGNIMAARLQHLLDAGTLCYICDEFFSNCVQEAVSLLTEENTASQDDVRRADVVIIMECDLLNLAPMMALAVRQAWRNGAQIYQIGSTSPTVASQQLFEARSASFLAEVPLSKAGKPVIICSARYSGPDTVHAVASGAAKIAYLFDCPNDFGCGLLAREQGAVALSTAITEGRIKGIISFEADLPEELLTGISVIGAADWKPSFLLAKAEVFLPTTAWVEQEGTFINHEGRAQRFNKVMNPGLPIKGLDPSGHPPRVHGTDTPGGDVAPSDSLIAMLIRRMGDTHTNEPLSGAWEKLRGLDAETTGMKMLQT